jgi:hypothetical protein
MGSFGIFVRVNSCAVICVVMREFTGLAVEVLRKRIVGTKRLLLYLCRLLPNLLKVLNVLSTFNQLVGSNMLG